MRLALADTLALDHPDVPWQLPTELPPGPDLRAALAYLEAKVTPAGEDALDTIITQVGVTFPSFNRLDEYEAGLRHDAWFAALKELPQDLLIEAFEMMVKTPFKRMPTPGEFRQFVESKFRRRWEELKRTREMLAAVVDKKPTPRPVPTKPQPSRAVICKGCIAAYVKMGKIDKAQPYENELAALEGREPRVLERAEAAPPQDPERVVVAKPHETSPEMKARMLRISAANRRSMGMTELAALYDARADALAPRPPDEVRDIAEAAT